jgi:hypothetical protein
MRPTWHFVMPADIRWMLALTASRVNAAMAYYYRQAEVDDALVARSFISYKDRSAVSDPSLFNGQASIAEYLYGYIVVMNGLVVGGWKRRVENGRAVVEVRLPISVGKDGIDALKSASEQYAAFIGKPVELVVS